MKIEIKRKLKRFFLVSISIFMVCSLSACSKEKKQEREYRDTAVEFMKTEDYDAAIAYFDKALALNDGKLRTLEIDMLKYRAEAEAAIGDYLAAAYTYSILIENDDARDEYLNLFAIYTIKGDGDMEKAIAAYDKAEEHDSLSIGHEEALGAIGTALIKTGKQENRERAINYFKTAMSDDARKSADLYSRMGKIYFEDGNIDNALEYFELALKTLQFEIEDAKENAGEDAKENAKENAGEEKLASKIELEKNITFNVAVCYEYKYEYEKALKLFNAYIDKYGEDEKVRHEILFLEPTLSQD